MLKTKKRMRFILDYVKAFSKNNFDQFSKPKLQIIINLAWVVLLRIERKNESVVRIRILTALSHR